MSGSGDSGIVIILCIVWIPSFLSAILALITLWSHHNCHMRIDWLLLVVNLLAIPNSWFVILTDRFELCRVFFLLISCLAMYVGYFYSLIGLIKNASHSPTCTPLWVRIIDWVIVTSGFLVLVLPALCLIPHWIGLICHYFERRRKEAELDRIMQSLLIPPNQNIEKSANYKQQLDKNFELKSRLKKSPLSPEDVMLIKQHHCLTLDPATTNQIREDIAPSCSACFLAVEVGQKYFQVPGCNHVFGIDCIPTSNRCLICNNNVRLAIVSKLYSLDLNK